MENKEKETFKYTYSAADREEIKRIRSKYVAPAEEEDKMEQIRRLDRSVTAKAGRLALTVGIIGALIMGLGMSFAMTELSEILGSYRNLGMVIGIVIGLIGMALVGYAYPLYNRTVNREREKVAPEILRLTDELMK